MRRRNSPLQLSNLTKQSKLVHGVSPRALGNVMKNRQVFLEAMGISHWPLVEAVQTHGDRIYVHRNGEVVPTEPLEDYDAFLSDARGVGFLVKVADCQPIFLYASDRDVIGLVHSGWRGSVQNIVGKTVQRMVKDFGVEADSIWAGIGPSIGPCCAEFSDPEKELPMLEGVASLKAHLGLDRRVDFWGITIEQLRGEGIPRGQVECVEICTVCHVDEWFSHRGERGGTGRFGAVIGLV